MKDDSSSFKPPTIDITEFYYDFRDLKIEQNIENRHERRQILHDKIFNACKEHGCFYIQIAKHQQEQQQQETYHQKEILDKLFDPKFIRDCCDTVYGSKEQEEKNGEFFACPFFSHTNLKTSRTKEKATYRGRSSESGDADSNLAEPKQSWEFIRQRDSDIDIKTTDGSDNNDVINKRLSCLQLWAEDLHLVAMVIAHLLDLPSTFISDSKTKNGMDLLRVFRYDYSTKSTTCDNVNIGSSPHTDWGTMTIVSQNEVDGLQIHRSDKWHDVQFPTSSDCNSNRYLFFHVGDFLSLTSKNQFHSPLHRVLLSSSEIRYSLVYFLYPSSSELTLRQGERQLQLGMENCERGRNIQYEHYSVLQNQCMNNNNGDKYESNSAKSVYNSIQDRSFHTVIHEKWNQVQRAK